MSDEKPLTEEEMRAYEEEPAGTAEEDLLKRAVGEIRSLRSRNAALEEALVGHLLDLHESLGRPCPTCRKSCELLGIELLGRCPTYSTSPKVKAALSVSPITGDDAQPSGASAPLETSRLKAGGGGKEPETTSD